MSDSLDELDRRILDVLLADGRVSVRTLADTLHVSRATAYSRYERLQQRGIVTGFGARVNSAAAGIGTSAYVTLRLEQSKWKSICRKLSALPGIEHIGLLGGEFDAICLVRAADNAGLRQLVLENIQGIDGVQSTQTLLLFEEPPARGVQFSRPAP